MIYNCLLLLATVFALPKWLLQKKYRGIVRDRLGLKLPPKTTKKETYWLHMVSVGETRSMIPIYQELRKRHPEAAFYLSSITKTGHAEAKRSLPAADQYFFLPLDFSWTMKRLAFLIRPKLFLLSESEFWPNLIQAVKSGGGKVLLINGKISERSASRFAKLPLKNRLFASFDHFFVQNKQCEARFRSLGAPKDKVTVTGNLKFAISSKKLTDREKCSLRKEFGIQESDRVITVGSTHDGEEDLLIPHIPPAYRVLLVARHPERFESLKTRYRKDPQVTVVDQMGILAACYQISELAILGGSFIPGIGGHNIFEPVQAGIPVLFGPFMETQPDLVESVLKGGAGLQVSEERALADWIGLALPLKESAERLADSGSEVLEKTVKALELNHLLE